MSRTITNSDIKKKGNKFHAVADWRDGSEGGTERETFDSFDDATAWIQKLESESDSGSSSSDSSNSTPDSTSPAQDSTNRPPVPVPGEDVDVDNRGDLSHSPAAQGHTPTAVPTATDKDTIPEPAASEMNPADAENINANIVPAPVPHGADTSGAGDPFLNPLTDDSVGKQDPVPQTDNTTSNEVQGVQDPNSNSHSSAQQSDNTESTTTSDDNANTASTTGQSS